MLSALTKYCDLATPLRLVGIKQKIKTTPKAKREFKAQKSRGSTLAILIKFDLSSRKPGHTTGGSGRRSAQRTVGGGRSWAKQVADISVGPEGNRPSSLPGYRKHLFRTSLRKHEYRKSYVNRWRNKTSGWQAVDPRLTSGLTAGPRALFVAGCLTVYRRLFFYKLFSCRACLGIGCFLTFNVISSHLFVETLCNKCRCWHRLARYFLAYSCQFE